MLFPASFRRVLCSAVLVLGTLSVLPGCKHSYRSHGVDSTLNPRFSSQPVDADYDDRAERNLSPRFESFPDLSPVPPLPGAGHSLPSDDALPPSPSPDSVSPTSLQLDSNPSTNPSPAIEPNLSPVAESSPRWKQMWKVPSFPKRAVAQPQISNITDKDFTRSRRRTSPVLQLIGANRKPCLESVVGGLKRNGSNCP